MSSVWSLRWEMNVSSWVSRLRMSFSRPANAFANVWLISCSWARPPPFSRIDADARACSVVGYVAALDSGITAPLVSCPCGASPVGGLSSMCIDPSRLVCPTLAVLLAGRWTSPSIRMVTSACQSCTSILVTLPTLTSPTRTRVFCWITTTSGNCAWIVYEPGPSPTVPGSVSEFRPRHWHPGSTRMLTTMRVAVTRRFMAASPAAGP